MPYRRRGRRLVRRKRSFKRSFKRRMFRKRQMGARYDSTVARKITEEIPLNFDSATGYAQATVSWYSTNQPPGFTGITINNCREFLNFTPSFNLYTVVGLKIEVYPSRAVMTTNQACLIFHTQMASLVNGADFNPGVTDNILRTADDYKEFPGMSGYCKKYIGVRKYLKRNGQPKYWSTVPASMPTSEEQTIVRITGAGFANANTIGTMRATWYMKFKHSI